MEQEQKQRIQRLINDLELCHHKAKRHVNLIIEAIGAGQTDKGYQGTEQKRIHPAIEMWQNVINVLSAWLSGKPPGIDDLDIGGYSAKQIIGFLGEHTELKEWQVQQVLNKLKASSRMYPEFEYHEMVEFPKEYEEHRNFRDYTIKVKIQDTKDGKKAEISLGSAIDHLELCNWNFSENLVLVLRAINGDMTPSKPFAACARNVKLNPISGRMRTIANTLRTYCELSASEDVDQSILEILGQRTSEKIDLVKMLERKIRGVFG